MLLDGGSLYDFAAWNDAPFTYPPFAGLLLAPLGLLAEDPVRILWTAATLGVVIGLAVLARHGEGLRMVKPTLCVPVAALLMFSSAPVSSNLRFGQVSVALVVLVLVDCLNITPVRYRGLATGIASAIKLTPMIFVVYWWISGQRRTAANAIATFSACTALAWLVLPHESLRFWFTEIWNVDRVGNIATGGNQSLNAALLRLGISDSWRIVLAGVIGLAIVAIAMVRASRAYRNREPFAATVIVGAAGLVFSPVSWTHHQVWLVLAGLLAVGNRRGTMIWFGLVTALMVLPITSLGAGLPTEVLTSNARLLLAVAVACAVPFAALTVRRADDVATPAGLSVNQAADCADARCKATRHTRPPTTVAAIPTSTPSPTTSSTPATSTSRNETSFPPSTTGSSKPSPRTG
ncbi:glycosyltransferase 87 family protein [Plantactinospora sp. KBS50]|uniref:glycosyltransferase 87 family protein n=1 Tax=Plantactinospora sp. KBS50 TaxID=2024580 RepID=UPI001E5B3380|nr:glycosyltransferase 87 family protein [Plantactinospora sp. KBS50]